MTADPDTGAHIVLRFPLEHPKRAEAGTKITEYCNIVFAFPYSTAVMRAKAHYWWLDGQRELHLPSDYKSSYPYYLNG